MTLRAGNPPKGSVACGKAIPNRFSSRETAASVVEHRKRVRREQQRKRLRNK